MATGGTDCSKDGIARYSHTCLLLHGCCTKLLRGVTRHFVKISTPDGFYPSPWTLQHFLRDKKQIILGDVVSNQLKKKHEEILYPPNGSDSNLNAWDLSLLCKVILRACKPKDILREDIKQLKRIRDELAHPTDAGISQAEFDCNKEVIDTIVDRNLKTLKDKKLEKEIHELRCIPEAEIPKPENLEAFLRQMQTQLASVSDDIACLPVDVRSLLLIPILQRVKDSLPSSVSNTSGLVVKVQIDVHNCTDGQKEEVDWTIIEALNGHTGSSMQPQEIINDIKERITPVLSQYGAVRDVRKKCVLIYVQCYSLCTLKQLVYHSALNQLNALFNPVTNIIRNIEGCEQAWLNVSTSANDVWTTLLQFVHDACTIMGNADSDMESVQFNASDTRRIPDLNDVSDSSCDEDETLNPANNNGGANVQHDHRTDSGVLISLQPRSIGQYIDTVEAFFDGRVDRNFEKLTPILKDYFQLKDLRITAKLVSTSIPEPSPAVIPDKFSRRDNTAIRMYKETLAESSVMARHIRVMIVGHCGVGKSSLANTLLDRSITTTGFTSTDCIEAYRQRCKVRLDDGNWEVMSADDKSVCAGRRLARLLRDRGKEQKTSLPQRQSITHDVPLFSFREPSPIHGVPSPVQSVSSLVYSVPSFSYCVSSPVDRVPLPTDSVLSHFYSAPLPAQSVPSPVDSVPSPTQSVSVLVDSVPLPTHSVPSPVDSVPSPTQSVSSPVDSVLSRYCGVSFPGNSVPVDSTSSPVDNVSVPIYNVSSPVDKSVHDMPSSIQESSPNQSKHKSTKDIPHGLAELKEPGAEEEKILQELKGLMTDVHESTNEPHVSIWDFSGQSIFYTSHQVFLSPKAVYLLVTDISRPLNDTVDGDSLLDDRGGSKCTVSDFIEFWLRSITQYSIQNETTASQKEVPRIILVGTYVDKLQKENRKRMVKEYFERVHKLPIMESLAEHIADEDFALDNSVADDPSLNNLKNKVVEIASKQDYWNEPVPARWISLEKALLELSFEGVKVMKKSGVIAIGESMLVPMTEDETEVFLRYHHEHGTFIYFNEPTLNNHVLLEPQWVMDALKSIITFTAWYPINLRHTDLGYSFVKFRRTAMMNLTLIEEMWSAEEYKSFNSHKDYLISLFVRLHLMVKISESHKLDAPITGQNVYLVPCMLKEAPPSHVLTPLHPCCVSSRLCFTIPINCHPATIFHRLLAACASQWNIAYQQGKALIFCGCGVFEVNPNHWVTLHLWKQLIQLWVTRHGDTEKGPDQSACQGVLQFAMKTLKSAMSTNSDIELHVKCPDVPIYSMDGLIDVNNLSGEEINCHAHETVHTLSASDLRSGWFKGSGTALSQLRIQSDIDQNEDTFPLQDLVLPHSQERSVPLPDVLSFRRQAQENEVGRELRRISDEFCSTFRSKSTGTPFSRLRIQSDRNKDASPVQDLVPPPLRDRSVSLPDVRCFRRESQESQVGRELRRISDEFSLAYRSTSVGRRSLVRRAVSALDWELVRNPISKLLATESQL